MPYRSPSFSSYSGGAMTRQERSAAARANPAFNAWREATKRAAAQLQDQKKADVVAGRPYKTRTVTGPDGRKEKRFVVSRDELDALTEKYFRQAGFQRSDRQSRAARTKRVHGMTTTQLHRPVSEDQAVDLYLQGYARQASEGHRTNPTGNRKYPQTGRVGLHQLKDQSLRGQPIPDRVKHDFKDPRVALRSRLMRTARRGSPAKGRKVIRACPPEAVDKDGRVSRKAAREHNCEDSWKLRRRRGWKHYQVPGVSYFESPKSARSSPLYKRAGKQLPTTAADRDASHLAAYRTFPRRRKMQSPGDYNMRVGKWYNDNPNVKRKSIASSSPSQKSSQSGGRARQGYQETFDDLFE